MFTRKRTLKKNQRIVYLENNLDQFEKEIDDFAVLISELEETQNEAKKLFERYKLLIKKLDKKISIINTFRYNYKIKK
ncbi:hypothetical protein [Mammaliicoccus lentus]|uniref:Uncharacterized protein n=1 Tax=Mammaliicoccus lentus TaxID=42858 RepID=A0ABS6GT98_MAMLE|nr:hypothetical protein [Mammaliicoccus lentus]MBF0750530.1 hypothetical protein [Mammaliicoccus lentus]MBU6112496.1 hypothetical protein [Mammaliicoccus lentus]TFU56377.1 hypothetical protein E4T93_14170 [Mammaliicoccus lentus]